MSTDHTFATIAALEAGDPDARYLYLVGYLDGLARTLGYPTPEDMPATGWGEDDVHAYLTAEHFGTAWDELRTKISRGLEGHR